MNIFKKYEELKILLQYELISLLVTITNTKCCKKSLKNYIYINGD